VTGAAHPLARATGLSTAQVVAAAAPFLQPWWNQPSARALEQLGVTLGPTLECPVQVARHTLLQGRGAALFAPSVVAHELASGALVALDVGDLPDLRTESALVTHASAGALSPLERELVASLARTSADLLVR